MAVKKLTEKMVERIPFTQGSKKQEVISDKGMPHLILKVGRRKKPSFGMEKPLAEGGRSSWASIQRLRLRTQGRLVEKQQKRFWMGAIPRPLTQIA